jgi:hypothetical protein
MDSVEQPEVLGIENSRTLGIKQRLSEIEPERKDELFISRNHGKKVGSLGVERLDQLKNRLPRFSDQLSTQDPLGIATSREQAP